jgi:hypothetical protein
MSATTPEHKRHHRGWQRRRNQRRDVPPGRTTPAPEVAAEAEAEARWLDDGGAAEETRDGVPVRYDGRPG